MSAQITVDTSTGVQEYPATWGAPPRIQLVATFPHGQQAGALLELKRAYDTAVAQIKETA